MRVLADIVLRNNAILIKGKKLELINAIPAGLPAAEGDERPGRPIPVPSLVLDPARWPMVYGDMTTLTAPGKDVSDEIMAKVRPEAVQPTQGERALEIQKAPDQPGPEGGRAENRDADWSAPYQPLDRAA